MKTVLVTGATGFTGTHVVPLLVKSGWRVRCFIRPTSDKSVLAGSTVDWVLGDLDDSSSLYNALESVDVLLNIASIGFGHARGIVEAAIASGVKRTIFISTTSIFTSLNAPSKSVRIAAEKTITESGLDFTIIRPTMIYGTSRDRNMSRLITYLKKWPIIPIFGKGEYLQQPVYIGDLAKAIVDAVSNDQAVGKSYNICGAKAISYNQIIDSVCEKLKRRVIKLHVPHKPVVAVLSLMEKMGLIFPIKAEQVLRLNENKDFSFEAAQRDFNYTPCQFGDGIAFELNEMGIDLP